MAIRVEVGANGYIVTGCLSCDNAPYLWFDNGEWIIDSDDGLRGHEAKFCPACGVRLKKFYLSQFQIEENENAFQIQEADALDVCPRPENGEEVGAAHAEHEIVTASEEETQDN